MLSDAVESCCTPAIGMRVSHRCHAKLGPPLNPRCASSSSEATCSRQGSGYSCMVHFAFRFYVTESLQHTHLKRLAMFVCVRTWLVHTAELRSHDPAVSRRPCHTKNVHTWPCHSYSVLLESRGFSQSRRCTVLSLLAHTPGKIRSDRG